MRRIHAVAVSLCLFVAACGQTAPTGPSSNTPGAGATISGSIGSGASSTASMGIRVTAAASPMKVSVAGTGLSTAVDASGGFVLNGVPAGTASLQFSGGGVSDTVSIPDVRTDETIALTLSVSTGLVELDSLQRVTGDTVQLEGRVESLPPTTAAGSLIVAGKQVTTDGQTTFTLDGAASSFNALAIGQRVHVAGKRSGTGLAAQSIAIQNTNTDLPVIINGQIQAFTGPASAFSFTIDGRLVKGDSATEFFGGSAFSNLSNGARVEVKGLQRNGFVYATRIHVNVDDTAPPQDDSASIEGLLTAKSGVAPQLTLVIDGTTVRTTSSTEVRRKGDVQDLGVLALNMTIHAVGTRQSDGSIVARMLQIKDDATGGAFEIAGSVGGLKGSCPAVSFGVNGYDVVADATTVFTPACTSLKSGAKVTVKGVTQAGGSVKASSITLN